MRIYLWTIGLVVNAAVFAGEADAQSPEPSWHVVLQDVQLKPLAVTSDGRLVVGAEPSNGEILHLVNLETRRAELTVRLPGRVGQAAYWPEGAVALSHDGAHIAAIARDTSGNSSAVYLISRANGRARVMCDGSGALAFDSAGRYLAVLGHIPALADDEEERNRPFRTADLGVYDLTEDRWIAKTPTPIGAPHRVAIEGTVVVGYGIGGNLHSMIRMTFKCDTSLDLETLAVTTNRGPTESSRPLATQEAEYSNYQPPAFVAREEQLLADAAERLSQISDKLRPGSGSNRWPEGVAIDAGSTGIRLVARQLLTPQREWKTPVYSLSSKGVVVNDCSLPVSTVIQRHEGTLFGVSRHKRNQLSVIDVRTCNTVVAIPRKHSEYGSDRSYHLAPDWILVPEQDEITTYALPSGDELASTTVAGMLDKPVLSRDGQRCAFVSSSGHETVRIDIVQSPTLASLRTILVEGYAYLPERHRHLQGPGMAMDNSGSQLGILLLNLWTRESVLRVFDVASGGLAREAVLPDRFPNQMLYAGSGCWLLRIGQQLQLLGSDGRWTSTSIPRVNVIHEVAPLLLPNIDWAAIRCHKQAYLFDLANDKVVDTWNSSGPWATAFEERVLVRFTGDLGNVEFVAVPSMDLLLSFHPVISEDYVGWIATTPDGYWDASPGAEEFVAVYRGSDVADAADTSARRRPGLVTGILSPPGLNGG